jgi:hypothetical protein
MPEQVLNRAEINARLEGSGGKRGAEPMQVVLTFNEPCPSGTRGGERGIRTPGRGVSPYNGLANRRLQPLGHLSVLSLHGLYPKRHPGFFVERDGASEINAAFLKESRTRGPFWSLWQKIRDSPNFLWSVVGPAKSTRLSSK